MSRAATLRELLAAERHGVLATISIRKAGWPFVSVAPYALSDDGEPLFLLSDLAEHTRNLRSDPRASLLVQDSTALEDPQAGARVTLLGTVEIHDNGSARERYLQRHPEAVDYAAMGDFHVWRLHVTEARFVNGFGDMGWLRDEKLHVALSA